MRILWCLLVLGVGLARGATADADGARTRATAQRLLVLLHGIATEYGEAFDPAGELVRPIELVEARALLGEAIARTDELAKPLADDVRATLDSLASALSGSTFADSVLRQTEELGRRITVATGVAPGLYAERPPSASRGAPLFRENCARCHGPDGAGDGPDAATLARKPANFRDPAFMAGETPDDFFTVVTLGRRESGMPAWGDVFSVEERWDLVALVRSFARAAASLDRGGRIFRAQCAPCHGLEGDGDGKEAMSLPVPPPDFSRPGALTGRSDEELLAGLAPAAGIPATLHDFGVLPLAERTDVVAYLRALTLDRPSVLSEGAGQGPAQVFTRVRRLVARAVDAARRDDTEALSLVTDAYLTFEPLERTIAARDAQAVRRVEEAFLHLREEIAGRNALGTPAGAGPVLAALATAEDVLMEGATVSPGWATGGLLAVGLLALPTVLANHRARRSA